MFEIEIGSYREDNTVYYKEEINGNERTVGIVIDIKRRFLMKPVALIYLKSFENWDEHEVMKFEEYTCVLERCFTYLDNLGYKVKLTNKSFS